MQQSSSLFKNTLPTAARPAQDASTASKDESQHLKDWRESTPYASDISCSASFVQSNSTPIPGASDATAR
jgi:hypothetical protein